MRGWNIGGFRQWCHLSSNWSGIYLIPHARWSDVLELDDVFYVLGLTMNLFLVLAMTNLRHVAEFDDQQVLVKDHSHDLGRVLAKGVQEGGLYKLLAKTIKHRDLVHDTDNLCRLWHKLDLVTYIMEHYLFWMTWCRDCWTSRWRRHDCARVMHSRSMPKLLVQVLSIDWKWFLNTWCVWYD